MNIFDFLSSGLGESEEDNTFLLFEVELVLVATRLLDDWASIFRKRNGRM